MLSGSDGVANSITLDMGHTLTVQGGRTLTVGSGTSTFNGTVNVGNGNPGGAGTLHLGGPTSWQALTYLRSLGPLRYCAFDCVEVSPPFDPAGVTAILLGRLGAEETQRILR